jgi:hypothetical protein
MCSVGRDPVYKPKIVFCKRRLIPLTSCNKIDLDNSHLASEEIPWLLLNFFHKGPPLVLSKVHFDNPPIYT